MAQFDTEENPISIGNENNYETLHHTKDSKVMHFLSHACLVHFFIIHATIDSPI